MRFSSRIGKKPVSDVIQVNDMSLALRNGLWNALCEAEFGKRGFMNGTSNESARIENFSKRLWADYFNLPFDKRPGYAPKTYDLIRDYFFKCDWFEVYDFIEFVIDYYGVQKAPGINAVLERELSGYRIVEGRVVPFTAQAEIQAVEEAIDDAVFPGASTHIKAALDLLSSKTKPDYRNSIKESISAVESACCAIIGSSGATLGQALKQLGKTRAIHPALANGFQDIYGYTCDGDGIRHALLEESDLKQSDAIYFLVSCSAFVNYLKARKTEERPV